MSYELKRDFQQVLSSQMVILYVFIYYNIQNKNNIVAIKIKRLKVWSAEPWDISY